MNIKYKIFLNNIPCVSIKARSKTIRAWAFEIWHRLDNLLYFFLRMNTNKSFIFLVRNKGIELGKFSKHISLLELHISLKKGNPSIDYEIRVKYNVTFNAFNRSDALPMSPDFDFSMEKSCVIIIVNKPLNSWFLSPFDFDLLENSQIGYIKRQ